MSAPAIREAFPIEPGQRVAIVGGSGTGKSYGAGELLQAQPQRALILDPKRTESVNRFGWRTTFDLDDVDSFAQNDPQEKLVIRWPFGYDRKALQSEIDMLAKWAFEVGDMIFYLDEIKMVCPNPQDAPPYLRDLCILGRERGVGFWGATQRPVGVPVEMLSEANHYFGFGLNKKNDRKRMGEAIEADIEDVFMLEQRQFVYLNPGKRIVSGPHWFE